MYEHTIENTDSKQFVIALIPFYPMSFVFFFLFFYCCVIQFLPWICLIWKCNTKKIRETWKPSEKHLNFIFCSALITFLTLLLACLCLRKWNVEIVFFPHFNLHRNNEYVQSFYIIATSWFLLSPQQNQTRCNFLCRLWK